MKFSVDPAYTVTIPIGVVLNAKDPTKLMDKYSNYTTLTASDVFLREGEKIVVKLSAASEFYMKAAGALEYKLPYTAYKVNVEDGQVDDNSKKAVKKTADPEEADVVAEFSGATTDFPKSVYVLYETDEALKYSGTYTDTVTYTISIEGSPVVVKNNSLSVGVYNFDYNESSFVKDETAEPFTIAYNTGETWAQNSTYIPADKKEEVGDVFEGTAAEETAKKYPAGWYWADAAYESSSSMVFYWSGTPGKYYALINITEGSKVTANAEISSEITYGLLR